MTEDEQEAESRRYGTGAFYVLPLSSGKIAILSDRRNLYCIVETWEEAKAAGLEMASREVIKVLPKGREVIKGLDLDKILSDLLL